MEEMKAKTTKLNLNLELAMQEALAINSQANIQMRWLLKPIADAEMEAMLRGIFENK